MPNAPLRQVARPRSRVLGRVSARGDAPPEASPVAGSTWTRGQVARELGCSVSAVRRLEASGKLAAATSAGGVRRFDPGAVRAVAAGRARLHRQPSRQASAADTAQTAARLWLDGASLARAVLELGAPVELMRRWWLAFEALPGRSAASGEELAELASALGASSTALPELLRCAHALRGLARSAQAMGH